MSCHSSTHCAAESVPVCGRKKKSSSIWFDGSGDAMAGQMKNWQKKERGRECWKTKRTENEEWGGEREAVE